jgi:Tol biopolymer transport system component
MMIARVIGALARPAIAGGVLTATAAGGFFAFNHFHNGGRGTAFERLQGTGTHLVLSEFGNRTDSIVAVDPNDVTSRTAIASVDHAPGFGIFATLSPDGRAIAYTALPPTTERPAPDAPAQAAVIDTNGETKLLADDIDLLVPPVWAPDGKSIVVRKNTPAPESAGTFDLILLGLDGSRSTITTWHSASVFPIGFAPGGSKLYFTTLNANGSDLYSVAPDGSGETQVAHLSDQITRDWTLSPDGASIAYTESISGQSPQLIVKRIDLASGGISLALPGDNTQSAFNPAWRPDGALSVGAVLTAGGGEAVSVAAGGAPRALTQTADSMDLPLTWSPDGGTLVVRVIEGKTPFEAGPSHIEIVDGSGERAPVSDDADVLVVGWTR